MVRLQGTVASGTGQGAHFMRLEWVRAAVRAAVGFDPYPGTLNLRLGEADTLRRWGGTRGGAALLLPPPPAEPCGGPRLSLPPGPGGSAAPARPPTSPPRG